jgi:hypothetical protein
MFKQLKQPVSLNLRSFAGAFLLTAMLLACFFWHRSSMHKERQAALLETELHNLSYELYQTSDYLTSEVRKFAVTLNPEHLRNYWKEINVTRRREMVIKRLKELQTPPEEFELLYKAKNNSDELVNTEIHSMRLLMEVYEVPEDQMEEAIRGYHLTNDDKALSFNQKVNKAREILYDDAYESAKEIIISPIQQYQVLMSERITREKETAQYRSDLSLKIMLVLIFLTSVFMFYIAWSVLFRITVPLKNLIHTIDPESDKSIELKAHPAKPVGLVSDLQRLVLEKPTE